MTTKYKMTIILREKSISALSEKCWIFFFDFNYYDFQTLGGIWKAGLIS